MNNKERVFNIVERLMNLLTWVLNHLFKSMGIEVKKLYYNLIEKLRFSLTLKITLVYTRKTISILNFISLCIIICFIIFSGWNAQEHMKRNFQWISDYLAEEIGTEEIEFVEKRVKRLAEIDNLSITIFNKEGDSLYTTESEHSSVVFYDKEAPTGILSINNNYVLVKDDTPIYYDFNQPFNINNHRFGYAMVLVEELQWQDTPIQIQIKNRMPKENTSLIIIGFVLLVINSFLVLSVVISGSKSSKKILKPIEVMTRTVENITINELNTRLDVSGSQDELKDLARTFNRMLDRIQESYEQQNQFVSDASHELRTPISVIQGYADLLDRWGKRDESVLDESLAAIKGETENMKELVEKLLFLARGDKNTQKVEKKDFYLNELIDEVIKETKMIDNTHDIIQLKNESILINADPRLIKESLRIFMDNCIKYTPNDGSIKIESVLKENEAEISIEDTGIGISKEDLPYVFNRFYRADKSRTKGMEGAGGTGLGLAIAKWIIQRHNGRISVESEVNIGTKVTINLPMQVKGKHL